jgi:tRNA (guanine37-N1)-methyltransferase
MKFEVLTLFPEMIEGYARQSILGKALERQKFYLEVTNVRDFSAGKHQVTDDSPYGGGAGMVMKAEPLTGAILAAKAKHPQARVVYLGPRGRTFTQTVAHELAGLDSLVLVCGRYEGIDERAFSVIDEEISLGDFIVTGGELGALLLIDAIARLLPGVLGNADSAASESFETGLLEHPQYTKPEVFSGVAVPEVLRSGNHARIEKWRRFKSLQVTMLRRPDLFAKIALTKTDFKLLTLNEEDL